MKAKLKELYSLELEHALEEFYPEHANDFGISLRMIIGLENTSGSESFDLFVCTPDWLKRQCAEEKLVWGRHMLIMLEYDFDQIKSEIENYIASCSGNDWAAIAEKLSRIGAWEFEDYKTS
jgi:hypothetical protein